MARNHYYVVRHDDHWAVEKDGRRVGEYNLQVEAEAAADEMARGDREAGREAEVNVQDNRGQSGEQRLFGRDHRSMT
jgi:hypothetical protein